MNLNSQTVQRDIRSVNSTWTRSRRAAFRTSCSRKFSNSRNPCGTRPRPSARFGRLREASGLDSNIKELRGIRRIIITRAGPSYYAHGRRIHDRGTPAGIPVEVEYASEFRYRNPIIDPGTPCSPSAVRRDGGHSRLKKRTTRAPRFSASVNAVGLSIARAWTAACTRTRVRDRRREHQAFTSQVAVPAMIAFFSGQAQGFVRGRRGSGRGDPGRCGPRRGNAETFGPIRGIAQFVKANNFPYLAAITTIRSRWKARSSSKMLHPRGRGYPRRR